MDGSPNIPSYTTESSIYYYLYAKKQLFLYAKKQLYFICSHESKMPLEIYLGTDCFPGEGYLGWLGDRIKIKC